MANFTTTATSSNTAANNGIFTTTTTQAATTNNTSGITNNTSGIWFEPAGQTITIGGGGTGGTLNDQWYIPYSAPYQSPFGTDGMPLTDAFVVYERRIKELEDRLAKIEQLKQPLNNNLFVWQDLVGMLNNIRHYIKSGISGTIILADSPKELKFGFVDNKYGCLWEIWMDRVKTTQQQMYINDGEAVLIPDCFENVELRQILLNILNRK